ncbi:protein strubbelig-receptor family 2-like [Trifolium pratense]|uniref:Protein strubbelig-receptor family 2-like n=1 Tax=Trifolium pratense TaxID=57577 RepID=A0A2K3NN66_TRIPR|nr:protein strubbelig-receptor family 2-like [Trifolium pratense]
MVRNCNYFNLVFAAFFAILISQGFAYTDPLDVAALKDMYRSLNYPQVLQGWNGGDPCEESWTGVACSGSSIIHLKIQGMNLTGSLGAALYNLQSLKIFDVSSNSIMGEIPYGLPPNATHINMACNYLSQNIPSSLSNMKKLRHLNLSHNFLFGPIGNVFTGLDNLKEMDLSYNNFTGDLPSSFGSLVNIEKLFLQNNRFTGSVTYLAELPLIYLNIQENLFSGILPQHFQSIPNLWIGSNMFHAVDGSPPWGFPLDGVPVEQNTSRPPTTQANAIENYAPPKAIKYKKKRIGLGGIAFMVGGGTLMVTGLALFIALSLNKFHTQRPESFVFESNHRTSFSSRPFPSNPFPSNPISAVKEVSPTAQDDSLQIPPFNAASLLDPRRLPSQKLKRMGETSRRSFSERDKYTGRTKVYTVAEVELVTNNFSEDNLLGVGSLGPVYRAELPDNKVLAVKNIQMAGLSFSEEEKFLDVVCTASRLKHPNIVALKGYCLEHGQHLLVYDYVRNLTLDDALHSASYKPLSWGLRLRIAIGVAQALDYLHSTFSPPVTHGNLKAANILLDEKLMPRVSDCGLAILKPLTNTKAKARASEIAIRDSGYDSPDHGQPGISSTKSDIFAFGVLLLELLSGRKPFEIFMPKEEQYLANWASSRLHDSESLEQMVDPAIKRTFSSKALSRYADIISVCTQPAKEFRPAMSEIVDSLVSFMQKLNVSKSAGGVADGTELDPLDRSFRTTTSRFIPSPSLSYVSA